MPISKRLLAVGVSLLASAALAAPATAEPPERTRTLAPPGPVSWTGTLASGANQSYNSASGEPCGDGLEDQCDTTLLRVNVPAGFWNNQGGGVQVDLDNYVPNAASDFDLYIYESNASGARGNLVDSSGGVPGLPESAEIPLADGYYLIQVVYFAVTASQYTGTARFVFRDVHAPVPPDVDDPLGLQDSLASNPSLGYRSHSEPHLAQSPISPNVLVAASKQYNRDPDSLPEYEFKVGTYVSFDRGRNWTDLGPTATCPQHLAPPSSWPNNTCYPRDNPNAEGTGPEDSGGNNFGEEYITSDPWVKFDDEGNAYLMVLDSPAFADGAGWGMSFHRWVTPSPADLQPGGKTWSKRIVINAYPNEFLRPHFLDDKNTFAVNNAGANRDGEIGNIVACWGQNITTAVKQQEVCERSTNGGLTWPDEPVPISPPSQQLAIGVDVAGDPGVAGRFYATWLHYAPSAAGAPSEYWFARSLDGGQTWTPATLITQVNQIPTQFPGSNFRNLSLPMIAVGPNSTLYVTYSEYRPAGPQDEDEMQADIMVVKSTNGGVTWGSPRVVNGDHTDADQFQPQIAVPPSGQVNISYFDRRKDPENFFIDSYLSRSNDGGLTFTDVRLSHDMWDPSINPPISGSGAFIGDYQGLVASNCNAVHFANDTHLANAPGRDPNFDQSEPSSRFQQVFSWRVPNTRAFGGRPVPGTNC